MHYDGTVDFSKLVVGDMCYYHYRGVLCLDRGHLNQLHLTAHYFARNSSRPPLILAMPDHTYKSPRYFLVDGQCYSNKCTRCGKGTKGHKWVANHSVCADGGAYNPRGYYDGWTVSGTPPLITVTPSINFDDDEHGVKHYHGFVQNGVIGNG